MSCTRCGAATGELTTTALVEGMEEQRWCEECFLSFQTWLLDGPEWRRTKGLPPLAREPHDTEPPTEPDAEALEVVVAQPPKKPTDDGKFLTERTHVSADGLIVQVRFKTKSEGTFALFDGTGEAGTGHFHLLSVQDHQSWHWGLRDNPGDLTERTERMKRLQKAIDEGAFELDPKLARDTARDTRSRLN